MASGDDNDALLRHSAIDERLDRIERALRPSQHDQARFERYVNRLGDLTSPVTYVQDIDPPAGIDSPAAIQERLNMRDIRLDRSGSRPFYGQEAELAESLRLQRLMRSPLADLDDAQLQERYEAEENAAMIAMARAQRTRAEMCKRRDGDE